MSVSSVAMQVALLFPYLRAVPGDMLELGAPSLLEASSSMICLGAAMDGSEVEALLSKLFTPRSSL